MPAFSPSQIAFLRRATDLASRTVGTRSDRDKAEIASYVLTAYRFTSTDVDDLAHRASQHFLLWQMQEPRLGRRDKTLAASLSD